MVFQLIVDSLVLTKDVAQFSYQNAIVFHICVIVLVGHSWRAEICFSELDTAGKLPR